MLKKIICVIACCIVLLTTGCGKSEKYMAELSFPQSQYSVSHNGTLKIQPDIVYSQAYEKGVTVAKEWSIENEHVATIDEDGVVTARAPGTTKVILIMEDLRAEAELKVYSPISEIYIEDIMLDNVIGAQAPVISVKPEGAPTDDIKLISLDENVARITEDGSIEPIGPGKAEIKAITPEGVFAVAYAYCNMYPYKLVAEPAEVTIMAGEYIDIDFNLTYTYDDEWYSYWNEFSFNVLDTDIACIENNQLRGLTSGETSLRIACDPYGHTYTDVLIHVI